MNLKATDFPALKAFALEKEIDMIVVGPEDPLVQGIFDSFKEDPATCHIDIIGPTQDTVNSLMSLELPAGVEIEIKL